MKFQFEPLRFFFCGLGYEWVAIESNEIKKKKATKLVVRALGFRVEQQDYYLACTMSETINGGAMAPSLRKSETGRVCAEFFLARNEGMSGVREGRGS